MSFLDFRQYVNLNMERLRLLDEVYQRERDVSSQRITGCRIPMERSTDLLLEYYDETEKLARWIYNRWGFPVPLTAPSYKDLKDALDKWRDRWDY